jgi:hypothetical protein
MNDRPRSDSKYDTSCGSPHSARALGHFGVDVGLGDLDALDVGDLGQDEQRADALLGVGRKSAWRSSLGLLRALR